MEKPPLNGSTFAVFADQCLVRAAIAADDSQYACSPGSGANRRASSTSR